MFGVDQIRQHLRAWAVTATPGDRLAPVRELADQWQCSPTTVRRAIVPLVDEGLLVTRTGKGTFASEAIAPDVPSVAPDSASALYARLRDWIATGRLIVGQSFPLTKQLTAEFSVSSSTVVKAYRRLMAEGLVEKLGRQYRVRAPGEMLSNNHRSEVYYFRPDAWQAPRHTGRSRPAKMMGQMCWELARNGARIRPRDTGTFLQFLSTGTESRHYPRGIVVEGYSNSVPPEVAARLEHYLYQAGTSRPTVVFSTGPTPGLPKGVEVFCDGNFHTERARTIARFAAARSFSSVVVCLDDGKRFAVDLRETLRIIPQMARFAPKVPVSFSILESKQLLTPDDAVERLVRVSSIAYVEGLLSKYESMGIEGLKERITIASAFDDILNGVPPKSLMVLRHRDPATKLREWCTQKRIVVPATVALLQAGDDDESLHSLVSTCSCDWWSTGYLLAHMLLGDIPVARTSRGLVPTRALICERDTT